MCLTFCFASLNNHRAFELAQVRGRANIVEHMLPSLEHPAPVKQQLSALLAKPPSLGPIQPPLPSRLAPTEDRLNAEGHRLDLRNLTIFTVDPPGARDLDDALHIRVLPRP